MIRTVFAVAAIALGVTAAIAQQDPIAARKALMKANGDQGKIGAAMIKGETPFDLAKAHEIFATWQNASAKAPALFPENSIDQPAADDPFSASLKSGRTWKTSKPGSPSSAPTPRRPTPRSRTWIPSRRPSPISARTIAAAATKSIVSRRADDDPPPRRPAAGSE